jgi:hypothetical protein
VPAGTSDKKFGECHENSQLNESAKDGDYYFVFKGRAFSITRSPPLQNKHAMAWAT